jgi:hypothetical protein
MSSADIEYRWWAIFLGGICIGTLFVMAGTTEGIQTTGIGLISAALGAGATAKIGPTK